MAELSTGAKVGIGLSLAAALGVGGYLIYKSGKDTKADAPFTAAQLAALRKLNPPAQIAAIRKQNPNISDEKLMKAHKELAKGLKGGGGSSGGGAPSGSGSTGGSKGGSKDRVDGYNGYGEKIDAYDDEYDDEEDLVDGYSGYGDKIDNGYGSYGDYGDYGDYGGGYGGYGQDYGGYDDYSGSYDSGSYDYSGGYGGGFSY